MKILVTGADGQLAKCIKDLYRKSKLEDEYIFLSAASTFVYPAQFIIQSISGCIYKYLSIIDLSQILKESL